MSHDVIRTQNRQRELDDMNGAYGKWKWLYLITYLTHSYMVCTVGAVHWKIALAISVMTLTVTEVINI